MNKRLKVLFLKQPPGRREPWVTDAEQAIGSRHDLIDFDPGAPVAPSSRVWMW